MEKTETKVNTQVSRKGDEVTVTTTTTTTKTKPGKSPEVKVDEKVDKYNVKNGLDTLPEDIRKMFEEKVDPSQIDYKAAHSNFEEDLLDEVNKFRKLHKADSLKKSDKLTKHAEERVKLMAEKDEMVKKTDKDKGYGESIYRYGSNDPKSKVDIDGMVKEWYEDAKNYDFDKEPEVLKSSITQVLWKSSKYFGAAAAKSKTNNIYVCCVFDPPGNVCGLFKENVLHPKTTIGSFLKGLVSKRDDSDSSASSDDEDDDEHDKEAFNKKGLDKHNRYRKKHGVPHLKYSKELAQYAQAWADKLAREGKFEHRQAESVKYGENIYMYMGSKMPSASDACRSWYNEIKDHQFGKEPTSMKSMHFTQMVWRECKDLGMGRAKGAGGRWIIVANYNPAGNMMGRFNDNVPQP